MTIDAGIVVLDNVRMKYKRLQRAKMVLWDDDAPYMLDYDWLAVDRKGRLLIFSYRSKPNRLIFPRWTIDQSGTVRVPIEGVII